MGPTTFFHHTDARKAEAILLRGFAGVGVDWGPLGLVNLTDTPDTRRGGGVVLRVEATPSMAQVILLHERPRTSGPRCFAVPPDALETAKMSILNREEVP